MTVLLVRLPEIGRLARTLRGRVAGSAEGPMLLALLTACRESPDGPKGPADSTPTDPTTGTHPTGTDSPPGTTAGALCPTPAAAPTDCALVEVRCVGDGQEYAAIADALEAAGAGDTVAVHAGTYDGFEVTASGEPGAMLSIVAVGEVELGDGPTGDGVRLTDVSYVRVQGFTFHGPSERCIAARDASPTRPMVGLEVLGNTCLDAGVEGFYLSEVSDSLVAGNEIRRSGASGSTRSHGIYLANAGSDGTTLACNTIADAGPAESNGIHFNGDLSVGGDGMISGLRVIGNVVFGNAQNGFNLDGVEDSVFAGNLVYDNASHALRAYAIDGANGPRGLEVVANTLVAPNGAAFKTSEDRGDHVVVDDVLVSLDEEEGAISIDSPGSFRSDGNVLYGVLSTDDQRTFTSFADWQALGFDAGSVVADPNAVFVAPGDYHPAPGGPAVDRGVDDPNVPPADLDGVARPAGGAVDAPAR